MRWFGLLILFISTQASAAQGPLLARVLIDETSLSQEFVGQIYIECLKSGKNLCQQKRYMLTRGFWTVRKWPNKIRLENKNANLIYELPGHNFLFEGPFRFQGHTVQKIELHESESRFPQWVLHIPVDQYLQGVLASEVPASWPQQALKAQAIASRTYFMFKRGERLKEDFDVRASIMDQVFSLDNPRYRSLVKAVTETAGLVLFDRTGREVFPAYFHSDCGGATSSEKQVWRKPASHNHSVRDPYCAAASRNNWSYKIAKSRLKKLLHTVLMIPKKAKLEAVLPRLTLEGRAHVVDFLFSERVLKRLSANDFRKLLGFGKLKSTQFEVDEDRDAVVFHGRGFGHGVGLCQWGAKRWARQGKDFRSILKHYYPGSRLARWPGQSGPGQQAQLSF